MRITYHGRHRFGKVRGRLVLCLVGVFLNPTKACIYYNRHETERDLVTIWLGKALGVFAARGLFFSTLVGRRKTVAQKQSSSRNPGRVRPPTRFLPTLRNMSLWDRKKALSSFLLSLSYSLAPPYPLALSALCYSLAPTIPSQDLSASLQKLSLCTSKACFGSCISRTSGSRRYRPLCSFCLASPPVPHLLS
jgi:hypothetical protein